MFWWGLIIGLFVGTMFGVFLIALCQAAAWGDRKLERGESEET